MKLRFLACMALSVAAAAEPVSDWRLIPVPSSIEQSAGEFRLEPRFSAVLDGYVTTRLERAVERMIRRLAGRTGLFFPDPREADRPGGAFHIRCESEGILTPGEDESYALEVRPDSILLRAETDLGCMHGLETLLQMLDADEQGYFFRTAKIQDKPRFPWRGLLIDVCRHFMPVEVIKRNLDGMAMVKMNVLHLHLTEDQGFRIESKTCPALHEMGSDGSYYTHSQIREIVKYADARGIRVVPEFDMPGHVTSWLAGYPELGSAAGPYSISRVWGVHDAALDPTREETYRFLEGFLAEMAGLFPDEYLHIGGDEVSGNHWNSNLHIQEFMKENGIPDNHALQAMFNKKVLAILEKNGKKMVGWDEIFQPGLPNTIVIQSWRGREAMEESARRGIRTILSNGYYIDLIQPTDFHYLNDPIPMDSPLSEEEKQYILGGEATMWAEFVSHETIDSRIWPRTAAIAERFWSPGSVKDLEELYRRLDWAVLWLEDFGLQHETVVEKMLRRLTNGSGTAPLRTLVEVVEPVRGYKRGTYLPYTSFSPLTRVVDAARPDARRAREFRGDVSRWIATRDPETGRRVRESLDLWKSNHEQLLPLISRSPVLREIETLSGDLSRIAAVGLEAMRRFPGRGNSAWVQKQLPVLEKAAEPRGQVELMILSAIRELVDAASK